MTTPSDPQTPGENPVPATPDPTPEEAAAAQDAADAAAAAAAQAESVRALATEIQTQIVSDIDPCTLRKGVIVSSESTANPPTVTITLSDSDTQIPAVRYLDSYSPVAGDTVQVLKQASGILVIGQVNDSPPTPADNGWQTSGGVSYRKVLDNGDFKIQLKGSFTVSGTTLFTLAAGYAPSVTRTMVAGRNGEDTSVLVQVSTGGVVTIVGGTQTLGTTDPGGNGANATGLNTGMGGNGANATGLNTGSGGNGANATGGNTGSGGNGANATGLNTGGASAGTAHVHSMNNHGHSINDHNHTLGAHGHSIDAHTHSLGGHGHSIDDHNHTLGAHGHSIDDHSHALTLALPTTVYFDGLEFFQ
jgi:hypothetical protein